MRISNGSQVRSGAVGLMRRFPGHPWNKLAQLLHGGVWGGQSGAARFGNVERFRANSGKPDLHEGFSNVLDFVHVDVLAAEEFLNLIVIDEHAEESARC